MKCKAIAAATMLACSSAGAVEQTVKNDSLGNGDSGSIVYGFAASEAASTWLTSPCNGTLRAVQVFWRSPTAGTTDEIHDSITVYRAGTFPVPGSEAAAIIGPVLTDGVMNEWRYLDENNTVPLQVALTNGEVFVVVFRYFDPPIVGGASLVRDADGIQASRNGLHALIGGSLFWFDSATLGLTGDWVIRGVVDCPTTAQQTDVVVSLTADQPTYTPGTGLAYTITINNNGPAAATNTSVVDIFPPGYTVSGWTCTATGGASCTSGGSGNITQQVNLPIGGQVVYSVNGSVIAGTTGNLYNSATAVVGAPVTDTNDANNTASLSLAPNLDPIFADDFET
jgi:uncharacterized repeat protein (TIGR01451 family)